MTLFSQTILFEKNTADNLQLSVKTPVLLKEIKNEQLREFFPHIRPTNENKYAQFSRRFDWGDRCIIATADNKPCHFTWIRTRGVMSISSAQKSFQLKNNQAWIFDCRTNENFRGLNIYSFVINRLSNDLLNNGYSSVMIDTTRDNKASVKGILKAGFIPVKKVWRFWKFKWTKRIT